MQPPMTWHLLGQPASPGRSSAPPRKEAYRSGKPRVFSIPLLLHRRTKSGTTFYLASGCNRFYDACRKLVGMDHLTVTTPVAVQLYFPLNAARLRRLAHGTVPACCRNLPGSVPSGSSPRFEGNPKGSPCLHQTLIHLSIIVIKLKYRFLLRMRAVFLGIKPFTPMAAAQKQKRNG